MPQQLGANSERGYIYPCDDLIWVDPSGYRKKGLIPDIVNSMMDAYNSGPKQENPKVKAAMEWARQHDWDEVCKQWVELFKNLEHRKIPTSIIGESL